MSALLLVASLVCFIIALLLSLAVFSGGNLTAWTLGGAVAFVASFLVGPVRTIATGAPRV